MDWFFDNIEKDIPFGYARFNDGEMIGIGESNTVVARGDQYVTEGLSSALKKSIMHKQDNYFIGIPCSLCYGYHNKVANQIIGEYKYLTSAVATTNRNWKDFIEKFPSAVKGKDIVWIGGKDQKVEALREMGLNIVKTVLVPQVNSWEFYEQIKQKVPAYFKEGQIVCISLGPTARVLVQEWFEEYPDMTFIDIGSNMDPFTRGVRHKCHIGWEETGFNVANPCKECN